jgi:hypothetical protein
LGTTPAFAELVSSSAANAPRLLLALEAALHSPSQPRLNSENAPTSSRACSIPAIPP